MHADKFDSEVANALSTAVKAVPALGILVWLWRMAINYGFDHWQLLAALP
ncbi:MAG TPA: hypothetical protein VKG65_10560 [Terriglobales bacterium]|nr:hypothetical protein [Terriglobales bacterium]